VVEQWREVTNLSPLDRLLEITKSEAGQTIITTTNFYADNTDEAV
jgi:hypothetical protein